MITVSVDSTRLDNALAMKRQIPRQYMPEIVNKSVLQVTLGSGSGAGLVQLTQKATEKRIESDLKKNKLGIKLAMKWLKDQGKKITRMAVSEAFLRISVARQKSRAYIAAGWLFSAMHLAPKVPTANLRRMRPPKGTTLYGPGTAAESFSRFATPGSFFAGVYNTSRGAGNVCTDAVVQIAVDNEARNVEQFIERKMGAAIRDAMEGTSHYARMVA